MVSSNASLADDEVPAAARRLARRPAYEAVYDRPDKVSWRDFFERVGTAERAPFETFYVADVLREPVAVRREGRAFQIGTSVSYDRTLDGTEVDGVVDD